LSCRFRPFRLFLAVVLFAMKLPNPEALFEDNLGH